MQQNKIFAGDIFLTERSSGRYKCAVDMARSVLTTADRYSVVCRQQWFATPTQAANTTHLVMCTSCARHARVMRRSDLPIARTRRRCRRRRLLVPGLRARCGIARHRTAPSCSHAPKTTLCTPRSPVRSKSTAPPRNGNKIDEPRANFKYLRWKV